MWILSRPQILPVSFPEVPDPLHSFFRNNSPNTQGWITVVCQSIVFFFKQKWCSLKKVASPAPESNNSLLVFPLDNHTPWYVAGVFNVLSSCHFTAWSIKNRCTQSRDLRQLILFTASSRTSLSETGGVPLQLVHEVKNAPTTRVVWAQDPGLHQGAPFPPTLLLPHQCTCQHHENNK